MESNGGVIFAVAESDVEPERELESILRVAAEAQATRRRIEVISRSDSENWMPQTVVIDGNTYWARTGTSVTTNGGNPNMTIGAGTEILGLLVPNTWVFSLDLQATKLIETVAARDCLVADARPLARPDAFDRVPASIGMIFGGDAFRLSIDAARGTVLRAVKFVNHEPAEICEFIEIAFDEVLAADSFTELT